MRLRRPSDSGELLVAILAGLCTLLFAWHWWPS